MKNFAIISVLLISVVLFGCQNTTSEDRSGIGRTTDAVQGGPYGEISLAIPAGWKADTYPADSDELYSGIYGIRFYPEGVTEGALSLFIWISSGAAEQDLKRKKQR